MGGTLTAQSAGEGTGTTMQYVMPLRLPSAPHGTPSAVNGSARDAADACEEANTSSAERLQRLRESFASASKRPSIVVPSPPCSPPSSPPREDGTPSSTLSAAASPLSSSGNGSPLLHASPLCRVLVAEDDRLSQTLMRKLLPKLQLKQLQRQWEVLMHSTGLGASADGEERTLYSLRHTCIMWRLLLGEGINTLALARNARTSVEMIDRFYAKPLSGEMNIEMLQSRRRPRAIFDGEG